MSPLAIHGGQPVLAEPAPVWPAPDEAILAALQQAWTDGSWGRYDGPHSERLVELLAEMHHIQYVLPCASGTVAVEVALRGLGVGAGDEVILAGYDFSGNFRAVEAIGARPVLVDIAADHWCLDARLVPRALTSRTRAVIVSHLHGTLADMRQLMILAQDHRLAVVEDACQVPGGIVQGRPAGSWGDVGVMSFGGSKLLTAGRGGALLTDREDVFQRAKVYCERGNQAFPLSELQCAVLPAQISKLAARNAQRQANATRLLQRWPAGNVLEPLHPHEPDNLPSYYKLGFKFHAPAFEPWSREQLIAALQAEGFPCDSGFRGFARRTANRCRHATALDHSRAAAEAAVLLHHPILLAAPNTMDLLATAVAKVVQYGRG